MLFPLVWGFSASELWLIGSDQSVIGAVLSAGFTAVSLASNSWVLMCAGQFYATLTKVKVI